MNNYVNVTVTVTVIKWGTIKAIEADTCVTSTYWKILSVPKQCSCIHKIEFFDEL